MTETRRLAAIMAIDVVGYSRLMGEDEAGTARAVRENQKQRGLSWRAGAAASSKRWATDCCLSFPP